MIEEIVSLQMPVDERLVVRKNRLEPAGATKRTKRISIVTGTHGDELNGQYVCYKLIERIRREPENLTGTVDVYPSINPLGIDTGSRGIPINDLDMNRVFPGNDSGAMAEHIAYKIIQDIIGSDMCVDVHSSNIFIREVPQVRLSPENYDSLLPYARLMNADIIWALSSSAYLESSLANSLNMFGVPSIVVEMGAGSRITREYARRMLDGIFMLMKELGIWQGSVAPVKEPIIAAPGGVSAVHAERSGLFILDDTKIGVDISEGRRIGKIVNPLTGDVLEEIVSPKDGFLLTLREHPVVYRGAIMARVCGTDVTGRDLGEESLYA
ncbi:MAG: M14 family metallopeptidase [Butyrivibrio sp.]|nr:M14 family metallopeptidase [Butyrivibrio sp.]